MPTILLHLALIAIFGILLPLRKGIEFLDPAVVSAYVCMGMIFAPPAAVTSFAKGGRPQSMREAFARAAKATGYGEGMALVMLAAGVVTVNVVRGGLRVPELDTLGESFLLGLTSTVALTLFAGWMTLRFSATAARTAVRAVLLVLLLAFLFRSQRLPEIALPGAGLAVALSGLMIFLLYGEVHPR